MDGGVLGDATSVSAASGQRGRRVPRHIVPTSIDQDILYDDPSRWMFGQAIKAEAAWIRPHASLEDGIGRWQVACFPERAVRTGIGPVVVK